MTRVKRLSELKKGQVVWVEYENPECNLEGSGDLEELDREGEAIRMLFVVENVWRATKLWEGGTLLPGDWRAELRPFVRTEIEDHLEDGGELGGRPVMVLPTTALQEMFGMDVEENFEEEIEASRYALGGEAHAAKVAGKLDDLVRLESQLLESADRLKEAEVTFNFSWGPGMPTEVLIETFEEGEV